MKLLLIIPIYFECLEAKEKVFKRMRDHLEPVLDKQTHLDILSLPKGATPSIECRLDRNINSTMIVQMALQAEESGYDGIFVSDMDMCGVDLCREVVSIPVIGGFRASAHTAMLLADTFSIITILDNVVSMQKGHIHHFGLADRFASIRVANVPVSELIDDPNQTISILAKEALKAIQNDGAHSIIFGCTGFIDVAEKVQGLLLESGYDIPVIDPNRAAINNLEILVKNKIKQSKKTYLTPQRNNLKNRVEVKINF